MPIRKIKNPYNFEKCRWCSHYFISHLSLSEEKQVCGWINSAERLIKCDCTDYAPEDNLEYLEMKYDQLGKSISGKSATIK